MVKQYIKLGIRNITKNKGFSLINLIGLSLGLASMMILVLLVYQYYNTDGFHDNKDRIYYLKTYMADGGSYSQTTFPLLYEIQRSCPEVEAATHWQGWNAPWLQYGSTEIQENTIYVDSGFFQVFSFPLLEGNAARALADKHAVVISQRVATQLFGNEKALGKTIAGTGVVTGTDSVYLTVSGVFEDMPANSSLRAEVLLPLQLLMDNEDIRASANWYNTFAANYLLLREGTDTELFNRKIDAIVEQFYAPEHKKTTVRTAPLSQLKTEGDPLIGTIIKGAAASAFFVVLIIIVNLLNLNTALMFNRTKEVSVRRMMGSGRSSIAWQFCMENGLLVFASLLLAYAIFSWLLLPLANSVMREGLGEIGFTWQQDYGIAAFFILIAAMIALVAGSVPAWYLTSVNVSDGVKGKTMKADSSGWGRRIFITLQFSLAVVLIGVALVLNNQIRFMKGASPGYNTAEVAVVNLNLAFKDQANAESRFETILNRLDEDAYVKAFSTTSVIPTAYWDNFNTYIDLENNKEVHLRHAASGAGFTETYQIPITAGRNFDDRLAASEEQSVIINETAAKAFGWDNPIGKQIKEKGGDDVYTVIGVMNDFHYGNLQQPINPLLHWYAGKAGLPYNSYLSIRMEPGHSQEVLAGLEQDFKAIPSRREFRYAYMDEMVGNQYSLIEGILKVANYVALLTLFIAGMGLFGLVALFARQRVKEIGIRKVLGASVLDLTTLLSKDFLKLVLLAIIIATPLAWYIMQSWLEDFAYRINISWWMFVLAGSGAFIIALLTVSIQAIKAARANPVENLRTE